VKPDVHKAIRKVNTDKWKTVSLEFGRDFLEIAVPPGIVTLSMKDTAVLPDPRASIEKALSSPAASPTIEKIIEKKRRPASELTASITVSDITRPVPYEGETGILIPLLRRLVDSGIRRQNIKIVVGNGTHRPSTAAEKVEMFGDDISREFQIVDHDCRDSRFLTYIGKTRGNTDVYINTDFFAADVKIVTGLVESHFMAGVSGGRKGVCPALVDQRTIEKFHGPVFLESPRADNLILEGNPCHEEALDVARTVGVDFMVNVTLDKNMQPTGVFAGDLEEAHSEAYRFMKNYTAIPLDREFDIVLTHGGYAGRNHYQTAKAGCAAVPAVKKNGTIIIAARICDHEPIGSPEYLNLLRRLKSLGVDGFLNLIQDPDWTFTKDQWQLQVWGRVLRKVGEQGLIFCAPQIPPEHFAPLPGRSGFDFLGDDEAPSGREVAQKMVQNSLLFVISQHLEQGRQPSLAILREGPYGIPYLREKWT
jgi:nickel-dependent lactate racemase